MKDSTDIRARRHGAGAERSHLRVVDDTMATQLSAEGRKRRARLLVAGTPWMLGGRRRAAIAIVILAGAIPYVAWELFPGEVPPPAKPAKPDLRYASQSGDNLKAREANVKQRSDEVVDAALETCAGIGVGRLAAKYSLPAEPELVSRRYASSYEHSYRERVYAGCLSGLRHGG